MRRARAGLGSLAIAAGLTATLALSAGAAPPDGGRTIQRGPVSDELPNPVEEKRRELREVALRKVLKGNATVRKRGASQVVKVGRANGEDQYVELAREKTDKIFVVLAEFGNERHPEYPDQDTDPATPGPARFDGPLHNQIPAPDRAKDNSTVWQPDYNRAHFEQLYFGTGDGVESVKTYYERQSSGRYSVDGNRHGLGAASRSTRRATAAATAIPCADSVCDNTWLLIKDAIDTWVADQHAAGPDRRADRRRPAVLRRVGPQRLRQRRQLQRVRRLHRPLPDRPLRRRPGRRRPVPG